jgi:hypothetical protein
LIWGDAFGASRQGDALLGVEGKEGKEEEEEEEGVNF